MARNSQFNTAMGHGQVQTTQSIIFWFNLIRWVVRPFVVGIAANRPSLSMDRSAGEYLGTPISFPLYV